MTERTSVLTVKARRSGAPALEARAVLRPAVRRLGAVALGFAGGWAVLYGALMPFGLGLVLGLAEDCFAPCAAGAALGVLLHGFGALSLRSVCLLCALGAAVAVRWVWPGRFLPAVLAGCGTLAAMGLCFALGTGGGAELALFCTADALLAGLLGLALRRFPPEKPGFGTLLTGAAVAAALGNLPLERFFPGVAVCAAVELVLCSRGQPGAALACSGMLGAALCAADPALACGAAGLACGAHSGPGPPGGSVCRLCGRLRDGGALRPAARAGLCSAVQRRGGHPVRAGSAQKLAGSCGRTGRPFPAGGARPLPGGGHPVGSRGPEPFVAGRDGERRVQCPAAPVRELPLGH